MSMDLECSSRLQARWAERPDRGPPWNASSVVTRHRLVLELLAGSLESRPVSCSTAPAVLAIVQIWSASSDAAAHVRSVCMRPLGPQAAASAHEPTKRRIPPEALSRCTGLASAPGPDGRAQAALGSGVARGAARRGRGQAHGAPATPARWPVSMGACEPQANGPRGQGHPVGRSLSPRGSNVRVHPWCLTLQAAAGGCVGAARLRGLRAGECSSRRRPRPGGPPPPAAH